MGDRYLVKQSFFAILVCTSHKEPVVASDFDLLYLKNYFKISKKHLVAKLKLYKIRSNCENKLFTPPCP